MSLYLCCSFPVFLLHSVFSPIVSASFARLLQIRPAKTFPRISVAFDPQTRQRSRALFFAPLPTCCQPAAGVGRCRPPFSASSLLDAARSRNFRLEPVVDQRETAPQIASAIASKRNISGAKSEIPCGCSILHDMSSSDTAPGDWHVGGAVVRNFRLDLTKSQTETAPQMPLL